MLVIFIAVDDRQKLCVMVQPTAQLVISPLKGELSTWKQCPSCTEMSVIFQLMQDHRYFLNSSMESIFTICVTECSDNIPVMWEQEKKIQLSVLLC